MDFDFSTVVIVAVAAAAVLRRAFDAGLVWRRLAKAFRADRTPMGKAVAGGGLQIGPVNFGPLIGFRISPRGLAMLPPALLRPVLPAVVVPWTRMRVVKYLRGALFRGYAVVVTAGDEEIELRLSDAVVKAARLYLGIPESERAS